MPQLKEEKLYSNKLDKFTTDLLSPTVMKYQGFE